MIGPQCIAEMEDVERIIRFSNYADVVKWIVLLAGCVGRRPQ